MGYLSWFEQHANKHAKLVEKLLKKNFSKDEIIAYFVFENMQLKELSFCPLYERNKKCHNLRYLNCFLCACPNFRFNDEGVLKEGDIITKSICSINSKKSAFLTHKKVKHLDCSACSVPHTKNYVKKHFKLSWKEIMKACQDV